jgi:hypothetical protein
LRIEPAEFVGPAVVVPIGVMSSINKAVAVRIDRIARERSLSDKRFRQAERERETNKFSTNHAMSDVIRIPQLAGA